MTKKMLKVIVLGISLVSCQMISVAISCVAYFRYLYWFSFRFVFSSLLQFYSSYNKKSKVYFRGTQEKLCLVFFFHGELYTVS